VRAAGASDGFLAQPDPRGEALTITAATAPALEDERIPLDSVSHAARAYREGAVVEMGDEQQTPGWPRVAEVTGARSGSFHPVRRGGDIVAVLAFVWTQPRRNPAGDRADVARMLASEAARAIERDARYALLARQARTDELTALPNRRAWDEAVERELSRAQRTGAPLCMALLDLDHFKAYNDTHGHQAGDTHLRRTAAAWRRELRTVDVLARYGGEEFGILLPDTTTAAAIDAIDRVRKATPNGQTASAGVVQWDGHESADALLARADAALYRAKGAGRALTLSA